MKGKAHWDTGFKPFKESDFSPVDRSRQENGLGPWTVKTVTKEAGGLSSKNMAVDLRIQGKKSPQKMGFRSNFWGLCRICGTFFRAFLTALFQLPGLEKGLDALTR